METSTPRNYVEEAIFIRQKDMRKKVLFTDILWIGVDGNYCDIHLVSGEIMIVTHSLGDVEKKLPPESFIRIHRSYIINTHHVDGIIGNTVKIGNNLLPVSAPYHQIVAPCFNLLEESDTLFKHKKREKRNGVDLDRYYQTVTDFLTPQP